MKRKTVSKNACHPCNLCCQPEKGISLHRLEKEVITSAGKKGILDSDSGQRRIKVTKSTDGSFCAALKDGKCVLHSTKPIKCISFPFRVFEGGEVVAPWGCKEIREFAERNPDQLKAEGETIWLRTEKLKDDKMLMHSLSTASKLGLISFPKRIKIILFEKDLKHKLLKGLLKK